MHGRELRLQRQRNRRIIEPDQGAIAGRPPPGALQFAQRTPRKFVSCGEQSAERCPAFDQATGRLGARNRCPVVVAPVDRHNRRIIRIQTMHSQRLTETGVPQRDVAVRQIADERNARMTEGNKMADRILSASQIVRDNIWAQIRRSHRADLNNRASVCLLRDDPLIDARQVDDDPARHSLDANLIVPMGENVAMESFLLQKTGLKSDNRVSVRGNLLTDAFEDTNMIGCSNPGDDDADHALTGSMH